MIWLSLIFWVLGLLAGIMMFLQAYGWNWPLWRCLAFGVGSVLLAVLLLYGCKGLVLKLAAALGEAGKLAAEGLAEKLLALL